MSEPILLRTPALDDLLTKVSRQECKKQLFTFANMVRRAARDEGLDDAAVGRAIKKALTDYGPTCKGVNAECMGLVQGAIEDFINAGDHGRDIIGRLLTHYMLQADAGVAMPKAGEDEEEGARQSFLPGVMPRPLLDYFLITVRGSVEGLDPIQSLPLIFGTGMGWLGDKEARLGQIIEDYRIEAPDAGEADEHAMAAEGATTSEAPIYWEGVFLDNRTRLLALQFFSEIAARIKDLGAEHYAMLLANLESKHRNTHGHTLMQRPFQVEDVAQLQGVILMAKSRQEDCLGFCLLGAG